MSQRLGGKDCRPSISYQPGYRDDRKPCQGRDLDSAGVRIPCEHNGFIGVPLRDLGVESLGRERYTAATLDSPNSKLMRDTRKPWKAPRLAAEGKPFEPALGAVGSFVAFERNGLLYFGQVWAKAPRPRHVWVATADGYAEAVDERELIAS